MRHARRTFPKVYLADPSASTNRAGMGDALACSTTRSSRVSFESTASESPRAPQVVHFANYPAGRMAVRRDCRSTAFIHECPTESL